MQVDVFGRIKCRPPIFRISCSFLSLWMILPEERNSMALKKACVQMWNNAMLGCFRPIATIISPSCLVVE